MFGLQVTVEPTTEPVSLPEARRQCGISDDAGYYDNDLQGFIKAARIYCERVTGKAFITQTLKLTRDCFPGWKEEYAIRLPRPPGLSVTSVKYDDYAGTEQTLSAATYVVDVSSEPARIGLAWGQIWPDTIEELGAVRVVYVAGYGAATAVPQTIKLAILMLVNHWFENRSAVGSVGGPVAMACQSLLGCEFSGSLAGTFG